MKLKESGLEIESDRFLDDSLAWISVIQVNKTNMKRVTTVLLFDECEDDVSEISTYVADIKNIIDEDSEIKLI